MMIRLVDYTQVEKGIFRCAAPLLFFSDFTLQRCRCAAPYWIQYKGTASRDIGRK